MTSCLTEGREVLPSMLRREREEGEVKCEGQNSQQQVGRERPVASAEPHQKLPLAKKQRDVRAKLLMQEMVQRSLSMQHIHPHNAIYFRIIEMKNLCSMHRKFP